MLTYLPYPGVISGFVTSACQKILKIGKKQKLEEENLLLFRTTSWFLMNFSEKMQLAIVLRTKKTQITN